MQIKVQYLPAKVPIFIIRFHWHNIKSIFFSI